ncbi:unnamed protein product [[Candida] boidinii]|uniref:Unnamed protein product n=1 Tax=Candida boidinii TaxID=5477 RepID=A0ACB5TRW5_CANBO|nr:unnamed protein product [[Candida] boidinii]GME97348.1 unnamed protein product [[Candida] boidinii]
MIHSVSGRHTAPLPVGRPKDTQKDTNPTPELNQRCRRWKITPGITGVQFAYTDWATFRQFKAVSGSFRHWRSKVNNACEAPDRAEAFPNQHFPHPDWVVQGGESWSTVVDGSKLIVHGRLAGDKFTVLIQISACLLPYPADARAPPAQ